ncbi:acyl CoA:acetate/3-ketoacid CoA transferase [Oxyplasma meridianum]|uniref:Acyl CoA:acetate/3-ketoacid CoA transferase n=1 Tax=Oxyplasma meridianum TaxID=3073602 RepID=A0AAX4NIS9_9ARCH
MRPEIVEFGDMSFLDCVKDRSVLAISGFNMATTPEYLIKSLYEKYTSTGHPKSLFIETDALPASSGRALDAILKDAYENGNEDFIRGMLVPFMGFSPWLQRMTVENSFQVYGWPIGITAYWFREIASGRPGLLTKIGLGTYLDPDVDSGSLNEKADEAKECTISKFSISKESYLLYRSPKPEIAFVRTSFSDRYGNLTMDDEPIRGTVMAITQATKARPNPGVVIAQVKKYLGDMSVPPRNVEIPYPLVDFVVSSPEKYNWQASSFYYDPRASFKSNPWNSRELPVEGGERNVPQSQQVIARRVAMELISVINSKGPPILINLGVGIPSLISGIISSEELSRNIVSVVESGPWGGLALTGPDFGVSLGAFAVSTIPDMFSNYEGGIIDVASLGFLQVDRFGNVNPSYIPGKLTGPGGFPVIAEGTPRAYFAGSFTAGKTDISFDKDGIHIKKDGDLVKFVNDVYKIFFSGKEAVKYSKEIKFFTERCVFSLDSRGLVLTEIAKGVDIDKDILNKMEFKPVIASDLKETPAVVYEDGKMNLKYAIKK